MIAISQPVAGVAGSLFLKVLIDDHITPMVAQARASFARSERSG